MTAARHALLGGVLAALIAGAAIGQPGPPRAYAPLDEPDVGPWTFVDLASVRMANSDPLSSARYADLLVVGLDEPAGAGRRNLSYRVLFSCSAPWLRPLTRVELDAEGRPVSPAASAEAATQDELPTTADIRTLACGPLPLERPVNASSSIPAAIAYRAGHSASPTPAAP